eukprot:TRINITY_DN893_c0_g1_i2.p1 TRINITY_DN893_c0_g1~~TRINITY_DN893_c0_g1_i2.p1  ORF type:complete len:252 (-),score=48.39 TRINITY_DN893_c0_g1_i2:122-877(-)
MAPLLKTLPHGCVTFLALYVVALLPSAASADGGADSSCPAGLQPELVAGGSAKQRSGGKPSMLLQMASPTKSSAPVGEEEEEEAKDPKPAPNVAAETSNRPNVASETSNLPSQEQQVQTATRPREQEQQVQTATGPPQQAKDNITAETPPDFTRSLFSLNLLARRVSRITGPAVSFFWKPIPLWGGAEADPTFFAVPLAVVASVFLSFIIVACIVVRYQPRRTKLDTQFEHVRFPEPKDYRLSKSLRSNCW